MDKTTKDDFVWVAVCVVLLFAAIIITAGATASVEQGSWQTQAVKHGAAYWKTADDGSTTFHWKNEAEQP